MTNNELKIWFWKKYNDCYPIYKGENIFMIYDKQFIRQRKLNRILGHETTIPEYNGQLCLFRLDVNVQILWCENQEICSYLRVNYNHNITDFIQTLLIENEELKTFIPLVGSFEYSKKLLSSENSAITRWRP